MNILEVKQFDVVNGPGIRMSIWTAGCTNACKGCWSPHTWNPDQGLPLNEVMPDILKAVQNEHVEGISILGGDPFMGLMNSEDISILNLLNLLGKYNKPIWMWTGYTFEQLVSKCKDDKFALEALSQIEVLVDGRFVGSKKDMKLKWRGSSNQRVLDMAKSLIYGKPIVYAAYQ